MKKSHSIQRAVLFLFFSTFILNAFTQNILINEFLALNSSTLRDEDGDYSDWIELYNPTSSDINLLDWSLTDDINIPQKWKFPNISLKAGGYLMVYASSKDRRTAGYNLHSNFELNGSGEYLGLYNASGMVVSDFNPSFPTQETNISYGFLNNSYLQFRDPTPGNSNSFSTGKIIPEPNFSHKHGYYNNTFQLEISTTLANARIYYSTNGNTPTDKNGILYTSAITISETTIIRAVIYQDGEFPGKVSTQSYFFADNIIQQPNNPVGYPSSWGPYTAISGKAIADYEMDPELTSNATFAADLKKAFQDLPSISIVTDISNLFSDVIDSITGGIYIYPGAPLTNFTYDTGRGWERKASVEYFDKNNKSFRLDCGLRIQGGHSRRPEKTPKHSFLLNFDGQYGPTKLNFPLLGEKSSSEFDKLILRAGFGNSWVHHDNNQRTKATYMEDIWTKDTQRAMGHPASNSTYVHLFLNGIYWGIYAPSERMDKDFAQRYIGGDDDDYDVIKDYAEVSDGNILAWNKMHELANAGLENDINYLLIQGKNADGTPNYQSESLVDVVNTADYMLINFYGGNSDWDNHNWAAMRNRVNPGKGFKFLCWDGEMMFSSVNSNILKENNANCPSRVYQQLLKNSNFKRLVADRVQRHCFNNGVLTPDSTAARWLRRKAQIENSIIAESARWGDYRRDVHPYQTQGPFYLYTKDDYWVPQQNYMLNTYFPQRTAKFITQLRDAGIFPTTDAPAFFINGKSNFGSTISKGDKLTMSTTKGTVYYTLDGTDPVDWSKNTTSESANIYSQGITLSSSTYIKARTLYNGEWSATSSSFYTIPSDFHDIKITEIHYHPLAGTLVDNSEFEFVELKNTGTFTLNLGGLRLSEAIEYEFPSETVLNPGAFTVIAANSNQFLSRYGFRPFDEYKGKLDNAGERIVLQTGAKDTISSISYFSSGDWPLKCNGEGYSLVPVVSNPKTNQNSAWEWRASFNIGGSPGEDDYSPASTPNTFANKPIGAELAQNFPNPLSNSTIIGYRIAENAHIELAVYDLLGNKINRLVSAAQSAGNYQAEWNAKDMNNNDIPNGIYFYQLTVHTADNQVILSGKMIVRK